MLLMSLFRAQNRHARTGGRVVLQIERLESRETPANLTVNTLADTHLANPARMPPGSDANGNISLRPAIEYANMIGGQSTINFAANVQGGTIELTLNSELNLNADIAINGNVTVARPAGQNVPAFRIIYVAEGRNCLLSGMTLVNGSFTAGGAISNSGHLTTYGLIIHDNIADFGGGVFNGGWLTMTYGIISYNDADFGGGIHNDYGGKTLILQSGIQISDNVATTGNGGGIYNNFESTCAAYGAVVVRNRATKGVASGGYGAGVYHMGTFEMTNGALSDNNADLHGGGICNETNFASSAATAFFHQVEIKENSAARDGGGFYVDSGAVGLDSSTLSGNTAHSGNGGYVNTLNGGEYVDGGNNTIVDDIVYLV